ncbi:MAG: leucine-rich repeat domain-containing protein [Bacteroidaceae bacterium]|nr:leucine-rich repeat domain-containing protein [Bacteroidaceae bacterium]
MRTNERCLFFIVAQVLALLCCQYVRCEVVTGTYYNVSWSFDTESGNLVIEGEGPMGGPHIWSGHSSPAPWNYRNEVALVKKPVRSVVVGNGITTIGSFAFSECDEIESIILGDDIKRIDMYAFYGCTSLSNINLPDGLEQIGSTAFGYCKSLKKINLPNTMKPSGSNGGAGLALECFMMSGLTEIHIPDGLCAPQWGFAGCDSLKTVVFEGNGIILEEAFRDCNNLSLVINYSEIPLTVSEDAFSSYCTLMVPYGCADSYKNNVVWSKFNIIEMAKPEVPLEGVDGSITWRFDTITNALTLSGDGTIKDYKAGEAPWMVHYGNDIFSIVINEGITGVGANAFNGCKNLESVSFPMGLKSIGDYAFAYCEKVNGILWVDSIERIGDYAFYYCRGLDSFTIPQNLSDSDMGREVLAYSRIKELSIPDSWRTIPNRCFYGCGDLQEIRLPESLERIEDAAFSGCYNLSSVTIPESVSFIGSYVFAYSGLTPFVLPPGIESISDGMFYGCIFTSIDIPEHVSHIGSSAFANCDRLTSVVIPSNVKTIGHNAFSECDSLKTIVISEGVQKVGGYAFSGCRNVSDVTISGSLTEIGNCAFGFDVYMDGRTGIGQVVVINMSRQPQTFTQPVSFTQGSFFSPFCARYNLINDVLVVPPGSVELYKAADGWKDFGIITDDLTNVDMIRKDSAPKAFYYDIQGLPSGRMHKGILIRDGKKYFMDH